MHDETLSEMSRDVWQKQHTNAPQGEQIERGDGSRPPSIENLRPIFDRCRKTDIWTRNPGKQPTHKQPIEPLTKAAMADHLAGRYAVGLCPMQRGSAVTLVALLDLDSHKGEVSWKEMIALAKRLMEAALLLYGIVLIPFRSTGGQGIHLYAIWPTDQPQDARSVRAALADVLAACGLTNGTKGVKAGQAEIFPKQDAVPADGWGNMFIVPGSGKSAALDAETVEPIDWSAIDWQLSDPVPEVAPPPPVVRTGYDTLELSRVRSALEAIDPNTLDYDAWLRTLYAVHAATEGSGEGLSLIHKWSSRFTRYDEAETTKQWRAAKIKPGGIGPGTLFKAAREAGWVDRSRAPTAEGLENLAEPVDVEAEVDRLVLAWIVDGWTDADLALLTARPALIEAVVAQLGEGAAAAREAIEKAKQGQVVPADASTRDLRLPVEAFPYTKKAGKVLMPVNHSANYVSMLQRSGFRLAYDVIQKEMQVTIHGQALPKSDHEGEVLLRRATDLCEVNRISTNGLQGTLTALVAGNPVNPVVDYLSTLVWDGKPRFDALAASVEPSDLRAARAAFRIFLVQACAAADGGERGMRANPHAQPKYETVLVLQGEQGAGKTSGLRRLLPAPLRAYFQDGVTLALGDKDSERQAVSAWVTELGELEATFRRSEIERLKSFTSRQVDRMRVAYGRTDSKFQRRTVFVATANSEKVLTDLTGNRRFAVLSVTTMEIGWSEAEIVQLWAEAWHRYCSGEQWWPRRDDEEVALKAAAEQFETTSGIEERLLARYDWERGMAGVRAAERQSLVTILDVLRPGAATGREHTQAELDRARETIRNLWRRHGAKLKAGKLSVRVLDRWTPIYAPDGKNRGYLLPPERGMADGVARFDGGGLL